MAEESFSIELEQQQDYRFLVRFDDPQVAPLVTDETPPLGGSAGPNPARLLATAVANCLAASLLFALRKFRNAPEPLHARATVEIGRNAERRLRIQRIGVDLRLGTSGEEMKMLERALAQFEEFCVVTESVRGGLAVDVSVHDAQGRLIKAAGVAA
ncbi:MAG: OsmC family protein [Burkholderiales bacterium]|nr:MAG: OsmC family protein [Burkholderiales bacterium]